MRADQPSTPLSEHKRRGLHRCLLAAVRFASHGGLAFGRGEGFRRRGCSPHSSASCQDHSLASQHRSVFPSARLSGKRPCRPLRGRFHLAAVTTVEASASAGSKGARLPLVPFAAPFAIEGAATTIGADTYSGHRPWLSTGSLGVPSIGCLILPLSLRSPCS
jgi:hypothetical protein